MTPPTLPTDEHRGQPGAGPAAAPATTSTRAEALPARLLRYDVATRPFLVLFELTRACELACRHCRAEALPRPGPGELTTSEVTTVLDDLADLGAPRPIVVLTGGDPLQRIDLEVIVRHGAERHLTMAVSPAGTRRASPSRLGALRDAGAAAVSLSLDGATATTHDAFRQVEGSFAWTLGACRAAVAAGLHLQLNTTVSRETVLELPAISRLVGELGARLWSLFFLVPVGRGGALSPLSAEETEDVLVFLTRVARDVPLKTTEAPHYRRLLADGTVRGSTPEPGPLARELNRRLDALVGPDAPPQSAPARRRPLAVGDGRGVVFVSHVGDVAPSGFLPFVVGNVRDRPLSSIYTDAPLLAALRDPTRLLGRCGRCGYRGICGGSRAQAFARTGDVLAEDPTCVFEPGPSSGETAAHRHLVAPAGPPAAPTGSSARARGA